MRTRLLVVLAALLTLTGCAASPAAAPTSASDSGRSATATSSTSDDSRTSPTVSTGGGGQLPDGVSLIVPLSTGSAPTGIISAFGSIWVASPRSRWLYRIDPQSGQITTQIDLAQDGSSSAAGGLYSCGPLVATATAVWVHACAYSGLTAVDPTDNRVIGRLDAGGVLNSDADTWACASDNKNLIKIDPATLQELAVISVPCGLQGFVEAGSAVVPDAAQDLTFNGTVRQIDLATGSEIQSWRIPSSGPETFAAYADGMLWLKSNTESVMNYLDTADGHTGQVAVPNFAVPTQFRDNPPVTGLGSVWLRSGPQTVSRFDLHTGDPQGQFPADPQGGSGYQTLDRDSLWISNFGSDSVWQVPVS